MENFDDYALPGGLDGLTKAIHNQHPNKKEKEKVETTPEAKAEEQKDKENEENEVKEVKAPKAVKKPAKKAELEEVQITDDMSSLDKVLAYADAFSKEYRGGVKKSGNMIMIDEDLKLSLDKLKLAFSGEQKLSVKHLANAIIKMFFEDEAVREALKARLKKL